MSIAYWMNAASVTAWSLVRDVVQCRETGLDFSKRLVRSGVDYSQHPKIRSAHFLDVCPGAAEIDVPLGAVRYTRSNANPYELYCITALIMLRRPRRVFEIGTFDGATTLMMAGASPEAEVITLDLPPSRAAHDAELEGERDLANKGLVGHRFQGLPESRRIRQVLGDSRTFDYSPYHGTCDFVFVDACHEYEFVRSDTSHALKLVAPGGMVVWHDYTPGWPGVVRALDELPIRSSMKHVAGTTLAICEAGAAASGRVS